MKSSPHRSHSACLQGSLQTASGVTLVEFLVTIMIVSLIMSVAFGAVRLGSRSLEAGIGRTNASEEIRIVSGFLRRQFAQVIAVSANGIESNRPVFAGNHYRIAFVTAAPRRGAVTGLIAYSLTVEEHDQFHRLVLEYAPFDPGDGYPENFESKGRLVLTGGLTAISFEYFGMKAGDSKASWKTEWSGNEENLPALVRIRLTAPDDGQYWPDLILRIRAERLS